MARIDGSVKERIEGHSIKIPFSGCWIWDSTIDKGGYARITVNGKTVSAHRTAYKEFIGEIPTGLEIDHLCKITFCVNPFHLEPVTHAVNVNRSNAATTNRYLASIRTHCRRGHEYSEENTYFYKSGYKQCRSCNREIYKGKNLG
jgi:hypothetical protein